jgi:predicted amidohydrolase YtcJ
MRVYEGRIITCQDGAPNDTSATGARYLVEERGRIVFVGDGLPEEYRSAPRVELGSRALLPAFADAHLHFLSYALFASSSALDLRDARSISEIVEMVRAAARPKKTVLGFGVSAHSLVEGRLPEKADLDSALPGVAAYLIKYDGHAAIASSELLERLPPRIRSLRGYEGEKGQVFQEAYFAATDFITSTVSPIALVEAMLRAFDLMAEKGIALIHPAEGVGFPRDMDVGLVRTVARGARNPIAVRVFFQTMDTAKALKRGLPRIGGCFATALDGCFGSVDAALLEPYSNDGANRGILFYPQERVDAFVAEAEGAGLQVAMHAIGDAAFDQAVTAFERALSPAGGGRPRRDHRHTIIHACLPTARGLEKAAELGLCVSAQPAFNDWPLEPQSYLEGILGKRAARLNPIRTLLRAGMTVAGGSDAPCTLPDPIAGIHAACNHGDPTESIDVMDAIRLFTINAAKLSFDEAERGSLEAGKVADMVILDRDPLAVKVTELKSLKVESLLLRGKPYESGGSVAGALARGLLSRAAT